MKYLFHLNFESGVHFGTDDAGFGREDVMGYAHSDTLFSALVNALASIRWKFNGVTWVEEFLDGKMEESSAPLPFLLSSFGFAERQNKPVYYLPKPIYFPYELISDTHLNQYGKDFKRRQFISLRTFKKWQQGETLDLQEIVREERESFWTLGMRVQHLTDNQTMSTQIYHTGMVFYHANIDPFFIVDLDESRLPVCDFIMLLNVVKRNGLGGRRTTGCGLFDFSEADWFCLDACDKNVNDPQGVDKVRKEFHDILEFNASGSYLFSLYFPDNMEKTNPISYDLTLRKGWFFSTSSSKQMKRKTCRMFSEGSLFSGLSPGRLVDVTPAAFTAHRIYRCGFPFTIPFNEVPS